MLLPAFLLGSGVRAIGAHHSIDKEFNLRRLALPLHLQPGAMLQGSLFFPITPGPQRLAISFRNAGVAQAVTIDLAPLATLHFATHQSAATPPPSSPAPSSPPPR